MTENAWDVLSSTFAGDTDPDSIPADAADNILLAWPPMLDLLQKHTRTNATILDFGCGGGRLVNELHQRGHTAIGVDPSKQMIESARSAFGADSAFYQGGIEIIADLGPFDAITSVMALQFVEDIQNVIAALARALVQRGLLIFAVHNPEFVQYGMDRGRYPSYTQTSCGRRTELRFRKGVSVPLFIRTAEEYNEIATPSDLTPIFRSEPPFTLEFIERYGIGSTDLSEYLILGYEKGAG